MGVQLITLGETRYGTVIVEDRRNRARFDRGDRVTVLSPEGKIYRNTGVVRRALQELTGLARLPHRGAYQDVSRIQRARTNLLQSATKRDADGMTRHRLQWYSAHARLHSALSPKSALYRSAGRALRESILEVTERGAIQGLLHGMAQFTLMRGHATVHDAHDYALELRDFAAQHQLPYAYDEALVSLQPGFRSAIARAIDEAKVAAAAGDPGAVQLWKETALIDAKTSCTRVAPEIFAPLLREANAKKSTLVLRDAERLAALGNVYEVKKAVEAAELFAKRGAVTVDSDVARRLILTAAENHVRSLIAQQEYAMTRGRFQDAFDLFFKIRSESHWYGISEHAEDQEDLREEICDALADQVGALVDGQDVQYGQRRSSLKEDYQNWCEAD